MPSQILLGAAGWDRPEWADSFFPTDMPQAWRLTYFNTQFGCVFLEQSIWRQADAHTQAAWAADTHEHFVFLLESAPVEALPAALAGRALGLARDDARLIWFDRETSLKTLGERLVALDAASQYFLLSRDGDLGQLERVRTLLELLGL